MPRSSSILGESTEYFQAFFSVRMLSADFIICFFDLFGLEGASEGCSGHGDTQGIVELVCSGTTAECPSTSPRVNLLISSLLGSCSMP